jgi:hypothetical protein
MIKAMLTGFAGIILLASASSANAAPLSMPGPSGDPAIVRVEGGCGPGGFRAENGGCYPRRPPPRYYERGCPPGTHPTPYGCRRNY